MEHKGRGVKSGTARATETAEDLPVVTISKDGNCSLNDRATNIHVIGQEILRRYGG